MAEGTNVGGIWYEVTADTSKLVNSVAPVDKSLDGLNRTFGKTDKAANQANFRMTKTAAAVKTMGAESNNARNSVAGLYRALAGLVTLRAAQSAIQAADAWTALQNRLRLVTKGQHELAQATEDVFRIAQSTSQEIDSIAQVYQRFAQNAGDLGMSLDDVAEVTDIVAKAVAISGSSAQAAEAALIQFGQAMASAELRGEELRSVMEQTPGLARAIADGLGVGIGALREMAEQGELTATAVIEALRRSAEGVERQFATRIKTVDQAWTELRNSVRRYLGEASAATGATDALASTLGVLGENIETVANLLVVAGAGALARYVAHLGAQAIAHARSMLAARAQAAEELRLAQAHMAATQAALAQATATSGLTAAHGRAAAAATAHAAALARMQAAQAAAIGVGSRLMSLLGGPIGIIALLASAATAALTFGRDSKSASGGVDDLAGSVDALTASLNELSNAGLSSAASGVQRRIEESARLAIQAQDKLKELQAELDRTPPGSQAAARIIEQMANWGTIYGEAQRGLDKLRDRAKEISDLQGRRGQAATGQTKADPEVAKRLQAMRDELELTKLTGAARARLQAIQKLGSKATAEERAEAERLATQIYELETAQKAASQASKDASQATTENMRVIAGLQDELRNASLEGKSLAQAQALARLNPFATPEDVEMVKQLAAALWEVKQAEADRALIREADPVQAELERYAEQLAAYQDLRDRMRITDEEYFEFRAEAEREHEETMLALQEQKFRRQSEWNDLLMTGIDTFGQAASAALAGVVSGTASAADAARAFANTILQQVIGSFVQMGIQHVKAIIMGRVAQSAAGAAYAAATAAQVQATTALAAQNAFMATAAIPIVGPALAPAAAATAAATAGALGTPAIALSAAAGTRQYGGPVAAEKMYRINETGRPEILNLANGQQFLLPNQRGEVVSNRDATRGADKASTRAASITNHITFAPVINTTWPLPDKEVRRLVKQLNDAVEDGMIIT